jgi:O-antigen/teichoic acid export membrane protein
MTVATPTAGLRGAVVAGVVGKAAEAATLVLLATVVPRLLGPADYGRLSVALTLVAIGSVAMTLGGTTLLSRFVPAARPEERPALARALTLRLARNRAVPFALLAVVGGVAAIVAPDRFPAAATAWVLVALVLNVAATLALQADLGLGRVVAWSARYPVQNAVLVAAVLALYAAGGTGGAIAAVAVAGAAGFALALAATRSLWLSGAAATAPIPDGATRFGLLQAGSGALTQLVQRGGVVAVALLAGSERQTGFAAAAIGATLAATYAVVQVFTLVLPALTARFEAAPGQGNHTAAGTSVDRGPAEAALRRIAGLLLAVVLPGAALAVLAVDVAVPVVLGSAYADAAAAFRIAVAAVALAPLNALVVQAAALRLRPAAALVAASAGAAAFLVAAVLAVPVWGAAGATAALLAGTAASAVTALVTLPGAVGWRLAAVSLAGSAAVAVWSVFA